MNKGILRALRKTRAQSIMEYAMLVVVASTAVGMMVIYIQRAINVRVRHLNQEMNESQR